MCVRNIYFLSVRKEFCQSNPSVWHFSTSLVLWEREQFWNCRTDKAPMVRCNSTRKRPEHQRKVFVILDQLASSALWLTVHCDLTCNALFSDQQLNSGILEHYTPIKDNPNSWQSIPLTHDICGLLKLTKMIWSHFWRRNFYCLVFAADVFTTYQSILLHLPRLGSGHYRGLDMPRHALEYKCKEQWDSAVTMPFIKENIGWWMVT